MSNSRPSAEQVGSEIVRYVLFELYPLVVLEIFASTVRCKEVIDDKIGHIVTQSMTAG